MSTSVTVTLSRPLATSAGEMSQLTMREPVVQDHLAAEDLVGASASSARFEGTLLAILTGLAPEDFNKMPMKDYKKLQDAYRNFLS